MLDQLCKICKKEVPIILIEGKGEYCLDCYNKMIMDERGIEDTYKYSRSMTVVESNGDLHKFYVKHMILGDIVSWDAWDQNEKYHFSEISDVRENGTAVARRFFQKILNGVYTKTLQEHRQRASNLLYRNGKWLSLRKKGTINIIEDEERDYQIGFEIDGHKFTVEELEKLIGPHMGASMQYQFHDPSDPILKEDEYLVPVHITSQSLEDELVRTINIYSERGFLSYKEVMKFDEAFYKITDKLEVLAHSEKHEDAVKAAKNMIDLLKEMETDDDTFPAFDIDLICGIVDPYGTDEELVKIRSELF